MVGMGGDDEGFSEAEPGFNEHTDLGADAVPDPAHAQALDALTWARHVAVRTWWP